MSTEKKPPSVTEGKPHSPSAGDIKPPRQEPGVASFCPSVLIQIIDAVADPVFVVDREHRVLLVNESFCAFTRRNREQIIGKTARDLFLFAEVENVWADTENVFLTGHESVSQQALMDAAGVSHAVLNKKKLCQDEHGRQMVVGVLRDITEQKKMEQRLAEAIAYQRTLIAASPIGIICCRATGEVVSANAEAAKFAGGTVEQLLKMNFRTSEALKQSGMLASAQKTLVTGQPSHGEFYVTTSFGKSLWLNVRFATFMHEGESYLLCVATDITAQKQTAAALQQSEERFRILFNNGNNAVFVHPPLQFTGVPGKFIEVNDTACRRLGYSREELLQLSPLDIDACDPLAVLPNHLAKFDEQGNGTWESCHRTKDGRTIPVEINLHRFELNGQAMVLAEVRDLSERKQAEIALRESEHRYRSLFTNMMQGLIYCRILFREGKAYDWIYLEANDAFASLIGVKHVAGLKISDRFPNFSETDPEVLEHYGRVASTGLPERFEIYMNASKTWFSISVYSPKPEHIVAILDVITERKQAEAELRKLSLALEQSPVSILITDPNGNIEYVNPKLVAVTGYTRTEIVGKNPRIFKSGLTPKKLYRDLWGAIKAGHEWHGELCNKKKNGEMFWESVSISPIIGTDGAIGHFLAVKEDISAHRLLEEEFRQAQKMEAFGRLAAGVAHDFNNLLTVIIGNAGMLNLGDSLDAGQLDALGEITSSAERAANLTRQLLMFSRRKAMQPQALQVNDLVDNMSKMLRRLIGEDIVLKTRFGAGDTIVLADPGMLEQILMNLAVNSRDAMPEGGELIIETSTLNIANPVGHQRPGCFVRLSVTDTGCGIPAKDLVHIFEPFFTTKEVGKGTGLGLATVFGIVEQHKGWIDVESRVGFGTAFHIHLPRHVVTSDTTFIAAAKSPEDGGGETILLVEDDPSVRALARGILTKYNYQVYEVDSGPAALEIWKQHHAEIDLLFTDIVMPGRMSGVQLGQQLLKEKSGLKVVYTSGYTDEMLDESSALRHTRSFINKPYSPEILLRIIRSALHP